MFSSQFILDKAYFNECFIESEKSGFKQQPKIALLVLLVSLGLVSIYVLKQNYLGNFLIILAVIECLAYYYRKPWWVARQMLSRASGSTVNLTINQSGIYAENPYKSFEIPWDDIIDVVETDLGIIVSRKKGNQYLSLRVLSDEALTFIKEQIKK